jgi:hypothetical protein
VNAVEQAQAAINEAEALYVNQGTGKWYDDGGDETRVAIALVAALKAQTAELRIAKRDAWAEGHEAGHDDYVGNDGTWPGTKNPYGDVS